jgi:hypothetical protein
MKANEIIEKGRAVAVGSSGWIGLLLHSVIGGAIGGFIGIAIWKTLGL